MDGNGTNAALKVIYNIKRCESIEIFESTSLTTPYMNTILAAIWYYYQLKCAKKLNIFLRKQNKPPSSHS